MSAREIADHGGKEVIVRRVAVVNDGLGQRFLALKRIQISRQRRALRIVPNGIEPCIRAKLAEQPRVIVAQGTQMKLFRPALLRIQPPKEEHHEGRKLGLLHAARPPCPFAPGRRCPPQS